MSRVSSKRNSPGGQFGRTKAATSNAGSACFSLAAETGSLPRMRKSKRLTSTGLSESKRVSQFIDSMLQDGLKNHKDIGQMAAIVRQSRFLRQGLPSPARDSGFSARPRSMNQGNIEWSRGPCYGPR